MFGEALLFGGAQERNTLRAQRSVCVDGRPIATLVVHVVFDYRTLPFIRSQSAYFDAFGASDGANPLEGPPAGEVEFTAYGWGLTAIYSSGPDAWPLDDATFARVYRSREPFWTVLRKGRRRRYNVYFANDRQFIYALGFAMPGVFDHLVRLAELTTLAAAGYVLVLIGNALFTRLARARAADRAVAAPRDPRQLLSEAVSRLRARVDLPRAHPGGGDPDVFRRPAHLRHQGGGDPDGRRRPAGHRGVGRAAAPGRRGDARCATT